MPPYPEWLTSIAATGTTIVGIPMLIMLAGASIYAILGQKKTRVVTRHRSLTTTETIGSLSYLGESEDEATRLRRAQMEELLELMEAALKRLSEREATALQLSVQGYTRQEIAEKLDIKPDTVSRLKRQAADKVEEILQEEIDTGSELIVRLG